jgi:hypothetical protein
MVLPLIAAAAIGAGGSIISGMMGSSAQRKADEQNYQIALMNYYQREQERQDAIMEARRQEREGKQGVTDAAGNRTYYKPGVGWVTELSRESQELQDLQRREEGLQLAQDLPAKRSKMFENIARQRGEGNRADALMEAMGRTRRESVDDVVGRRNRMSTEAINEGMDTALSSAMREALISGSSNAGRIAEDIGRSKSKQLRTAFMENEEGAREASEANYFNKQGNLANLYNTFATRASAMPDAPYNPRNIEGIANEQLSGARSAGGQSSGALLNAIGKQGGTMDYKAEPLYGPANTVQSTANVLSGALDQYYYGNKYGSAHDDYNNYAYGGQSPYQKGRGSFV